MARSPVAGPVPVTFVISHALSGGSERYLELLLDHLAPAWVHGVVSLQDGPFVPRLRASGFEVEVVETGPRLSMLASALRVRRLINRDPPAVIHANGVKAALVLMPEGSAFRARYNPEVWRQIKDFLDALSRTYDAPLINAREWIEDDGFFDSHHLIIPGAITLARRLSREGVLPLLQDWTLGTSPGQMPSLGSGCRK